MLGKMKEYRYCYRLILILILSSCSSVKSYRSFNYFNGVDYYNDALKVSGTFFGDIAFADEIETVRINKEAIKPYKKKDLLVYGKSKGEYEVFLFLGKRKNSSNGIHLVLNDTTNQRVAYQKVENDKKLILLLISDGQKKSNNTILRDGISIMNSIEFDNTKKNHLSYLDIFNSLKHENNFLYVLHKLDNAPIEETNKSNWEKTQLTLTLLSNDAESKKYKELLYDLENPIKNRQQKYVDSIVQKGCCFSDNEAIAQISKLSKETKILMLNENHWKPNHRMMAQKLLEPLKNNGYKYLAVEAVNKGRDSILNIRKYPTKNTGYYPREPYFGLFIREAKRLGYIIVGYDDFEENREESQARNIKKILDKDATAKIFVYAGFDHILEYNPTKKRMAAYVKEITGINPLTIDQAEVVAAIENEFTLIESKHLEQADRVNTNVDYFLINNLLPNLDKLFETSNLTSISIADAALNNYLNKKVLVSVYYQNEYEKYKSNSIPILNKIIHIQENNLTLKVPSSELIVKIMDADNNLILINKIETE